jgi:hypothetical protein
MEEPMFGLFDVDMNKAVSDDGDNPIRIVTAYEHETRTVGTMLAEHFIKPQAFDTQAPHSVHIAAYGPMCIGKSVMLNGAAHHLSDGLVCERERTEPTFHTLNAGIDLGFMDFGRVVIGGSPAACYTSFPYARRWPVACLDGRPRVSLTQHTLPQHLMDDGAVVVVSRIRSVAQGIELCADEGYYHGQQMPLILEKTLQHIDAKWQAQPNKTSPDMGDLRQEWVAAMRAATARTVKILKQEVADVAGFPHGDVMKVLGAVYPDGSMWRQAYRMITIHRTADTPTARAGFERFREAVRARFCTFDGDKLRAPSHA